ncbi:beta-glucosidase BglX [Paenibacillus sp. LPE1-1-1.1]|uniref:beta-glucosidase BglX n=1 Tax=Paenibacillus sp. LPE1-1-1.1 TaxID=3135230 RepID=UPI00343D2E07
MIGIWHASKTVNGSVFKLLFSITENDGYKLAINSEPTPAFILPMDAQIEGNNLRAEGRSFFTPDPVCVTLVFEGDTFRGTVTLPFMGELQIEGERGRGRSLSEDLIPKVMPYRKTGVNLRSDADIRQEVEKLLDRMTLLDKIGQMSQSGASDFSFGSDVESEPTEKLVAEGKVGSILGAFDINRVFELQKIAVEQSPHRIPLLFNADIIHGFQTIFPVPLAWSCSWDLEAIKRACAISAKEAAASGTTFNHGPMVDITRDPRWGRVVEGAGEDPYLGALIARAQVEGFQGDNLFDNETIIACLKHFIAYGAAEGGRDYNTVDISEGTLRNVFLPPFKEGIEAGAGSVMNAFNIYQSMPVAGSRYLLNDLLRDELGFDGMLISDYGAIEEIHIHGAAKDGKEAAKLALEATMDIEMVTRLYFRYLPELIKEGVIKEEQIDEAVRRILTFKFKIGIMDDPFRYVQPEKEMEYHFNTAHLEASRDLARKSIVLLKNDGVLPLRNDGRTVALIGPFAASQDLLGPWQFSRYGMETVTLRDGLVAKGFTSERLLVASGCGVDSEIEGGFDKALAAATRADVVVLALGEDSNMSGEAASRADIELPAVQRKLAEAIVGLGKPTVLVLTNGRPLILDWFDQHVNAIVETWFAGSQAGHAITDVLLGEYNPSGRLTMSFPHHAGQVPIYYNHFNTGRPVTPENAHMKFNSKYLDSPNEPLYPFGFGLSYSAVEYTEPLLDKCVMSRTESLSASVEVKNIGDLTCEETVQLYIQDLHGSVVRPVKELKGFRKIKLEPGETQVVTFDVMEKDLEYYLPDNSFKAEAGLFKLFIGPNARVVKEASFELTD